MDSLGHMLYCYQGKTERGKAKQEKKPHTCAEICRRNVYIPFPANTEGTALTPPSTPPFSVIPSLSGRTAKNNSLGTDGTTATATSVHVRVFDTKVASTVVSVMTTKVVITIVACS